MNEELVEFAHSEDSTFIETRRERTQNLIENQNDRDHSILEVTILNQKPSGTVDRKVKIDKYDEGFFGRPSITLECTFTY